MTSLLNRSQPTPAHQSGFTRRHSTETLLTFLYNKLVSAISHQQVSCLCLLNISAAFDTIDHNILLKRLSAWFDFTDSSGFSPIFLLALSPSEHRNIITAQLDYCSSLFAGLPVGRLWCLDRVLCTAARLSGRIPKFGHVSSYMLDVLHWLLHQQRISYHIISLIC